MDTCFQVASMPSLARGSENVYLAADTLMKASGCVVFMKYLDRQLVLSGSSLLPMVVWMYFLSGTTKVLRRFIFFYALI